MTSLYLRGGSRKPIHLTLRGCTMDDAERASLKTARFRGNNFGLPLH